MKWPNESIYFYLTIAFILIFPSVIGAQEYAININDGKMDDYWGTKGPIVSNAVGYDDEPVIGLDGDIVNAWVEFDSDDPNVLYFRVDGYDIDGSVYVEFDCDGDGAFTSQIDRAITLSTLSYTSDFGGVAGGPIDYTQEFLDDPNNINLELGSIESAKGEFVITEVQDQEGDEYEFMEIEAYLDISGDKKFTGDMAPCFGNRNDDAWNIGYRFYSWTDLTPTQNRQVLTAIVLKDQGAFSPNNASLTVVFALILTTLTLSLLIWRRKTGKINL